MPEHFEERRKLELQLQRAMRRCNRRIKRRLLAGMGSPPDPRNIPQDVWNQVRRECAEDPLPTLRQVYLFAFGALAALFGYFLLRARQETLREANDRSTRARLDEMARRRIDRIRQKLSRKAVDGGPVAWSKELDKQLGLPKDDETGPTSQEEATASTEVTGQMSRGELDYVGGVEAEVNFRLEKTWNTERDARVCPICTPLHRTPERVWSPISPGGPPAHVRCRCWLTYRKDANGPPADFIPDGEIGL